MQEAEWPKPFYLLPVVRWNFSLFLLVPSAFMLVAGFLGPNLVFLVLAAFPVACAVLYELKARHPAAEAWPDRISIQGPATWKLVSIPYGQITRLEEIPYVRFTVFYESLGKRRKVYIPAAFLPGLESLKELLIAKSGLVMTIRQPWWARPLTKHGPLVAWDEPGAWMRALLLVFVPLLLYQYTAIGIWLGWLWLAEIGWLPKWPPFGLGIVMGLLAFVGGFILIRQGRYLLVTALMVPLTIAPVAVVWLRYGLVPPLWMWVPPALAAIGLVVVAVSSQRRQPINP